MASRAAHPYVCARCASKFLRPNHTWSAIFPRKSYVTKSKSTDESTTVANETQNATNNIVHPDVASEPGAMSRRLQEATDELLLTGGKAGRRAVEDAGFSEELKEKLLAKVKDAQFRSQHAGAFSEVDMPASAGEGTRITATSRPWTGQETAEDGVLRMLTDAHKHLDPELRGRPKIPDLRPVDMRIRQQPKLNPGHRVAHARDKASMYVGMSVKESQGGLDEQERAARRQELRERFQPGARALPNTLAGLASLANQRIDDAIARGQFKNIPRGKDAAGVTTKIDNPFIDTTEHIMNNMIKRQDMVPPWIEKQQELVKATHAFRSRLRNDWRRHAARTIASKGGSLEAQIERARQYARAEQLHNPRKGDVDPSAAPPNSAGGVKTRTRTEESHTTASSTIEPEAPILGPFRDPDWLKTEQSYMELSIKNLNTLARSYNLMAPELAKKPYFKLERELHNCYADVAPLLADTIRDRATRPKKPLVEAIADRPGRILDRFGHHGAKAKVHDSKAPHYGFKEMWRDLFSK
ncbi:hypothetical protein EKO27_g602 [Xylaria grammica]|uniref:DnaJ homologue subfamily C member 28 conserved domain-containing protein n=1 Tax=Xylaria grammica TaxID=363999 RepID=A0A439DJC8_9PEZI|nr:hypothetical protein EKO27_g602 [Xylaria grammica]